MKKQRGQAPAGGPKATAQWPPSHPLPLCHDWIG